MILIFRTVSLRLLGSWAYKSQVIILSFQSTLILFWLMNSFHSHSHEHRRSIYLRHMIRVKEVSIRHSHYQSTLLRLAPPRWQQIVWRRNSIWSVVSWCNSCTHLKRMIDSNRHSYDRWRKSPKRRVEDCKRNRPRKEKYSFNNWKNWNSGGRNFNKNIRRKRETYQHQMNHNSRHPRSRRWSGRRAFLFLILQPLGYKSLFISFANTNDFEHSTFGSSDHSRVWFEVWLKCMLIFHHVEARVKT